MKFIFFFKKKEEKKGINVFQCDPLRDGHVSRLQNTNVLTLLLSMTLAFGEPG